MIGNDILSVIFLALVCVVIAGLVRNMLPNNSILIVPSFVFVSACLWIAFDYILMRRYEAKARCNQDKKNIIDIRREIDEINNDAYSIDPDQLNTDSNTPKPQRVPVVKTQDEDFDIDLYNGLNDMRDLYQHMGAAGDNRTANRMKYLGMQPQVEKNIRASHNRYTLQPYFEEELRENEEREWWNVDQTELE